jgi:hypothetical protein
MTSTSGVCTPTAKNAVLNVNDLTAMLASGNVTVNTGTGSLPAEVADIVIAATFNWASANALTLVAYESVVFNKPVSVAGSDAVSLVTDDGGDDGSLSFGAKGSLSFVGTENSLMINGQAYVLENSIATLATAIANNPSGNYAFSASYDAKQDGAYPASPLRPSWKAR